MEGEGHGSDHAVKAKPLEHTFFLPMKMEKLQAFTPDFNQIETKELVEESLGDWHEVFKSRFHREVNQGNASILCDSFDVAFDNLQWKNAEDKESISLSELTNWRSVDLFEAFEYRDWSASYFWYTDSKNSQPQEVWLARESPHIMVTMAHGHASDDDCLFLGEIQVIIALMIVRLVNNSFPDHNVVPVMLFSFTGDKHGKILQAHMDRESLVIRKSHFYDFSARKDGHLQTFLRYMVCDLQGQTKILDLPEIKSKIAQQEA
jgi:hypothetical protein